MLKKLGDSRSGKPAPNPVIGGLLECHERIRRFTSYAARLGEPEAFEPEQVRDAAHAVARYFREALPLHSADEDESIAPRLGDAPPDVAAAIAAMREQHAGIHAVLDEMIPLWERVAADPSEREAVREQLAAGAARLEMLFTEHLRGEEQHVLPAIERLAPETIERIAAEMKARRQPGD